MRDKKRTHRSRSVSKNAQKKSKKIHKQSKSHSKKKDKRDKKRSKSRSKSSSRHRKEKKRNRSRSRSKKTRRETSEEIELKKKERQAKLIAMKFEKAPIQQVQSDDLPPPIPIEILLKLTQQQEKQVSKEDEAWLEEKVSSDIYQDDFVLHEEQTAKADIQSDDPLDAYMSSIQKDYVQQEIVTRQDHLYSQIYSQASKDKGAKQIPKEPEAILEEIQQEEIGEQQLEQMILEGEQMEDEYDDTKVANMEDIMMKQEQVDSEDDDKFYEEFKKALQKQKKQKMEVKDIALNEETAFLDGGVSDDENYVIEEETTGIPDFLERQKKHSTRKILVPVDHDEINYEPFRKNFYKESSDQQAMSLEEVKLLRKLLGDMKVRGKDCPKPIQNWFQCGLSDKILEFLIDKKKYLTPFAIQAQAIPAIMSGRDVIGIAETGSGKTLAYLIPMFRHIKDQKPLADGDGPIAVIMAPTRELANQIFIECRAFSKIMGIRSVCVYGGAGVSGQISDLKKGAEVVICTPGRMIDVLTTSNGKITNLRRVTYVVIDEADRMFDYGFEPQIKKIFSNIRPDRQTVMFSATFPTNVETLAKNILKNPIEIIIGTRGQACQSIEQIVMVMEETEKFWRLLELLGQWSEIGSIIIFVDKQTEADELFKELLKHQYFPFVLHGGQDQVDRENTLIDFKKGKRNILIATSICSRGLDIQNIVLVINFKCPSYVEDYIHRIGRTGRAGNKGTAITFFTQADENFGIALEKILQLNKQVIPKQLEYICQNFKEKVKKGEAKMFVNQHLQGKGYSFNEEESKKGEEKKTLFKHQFNMINNIEEELSDSEVFKEEELTEQQKRDLVKADKKSQRLCLELIKNPEAKSQVMQAATRAAKEAILAGAGTDEVLFLTQKAIKQMLNLYKPTGETTGLEAGLEQMMAVRDEVEQYSVTHGDRVTADLEINDYPLNARKKVVDKEFLCSITDMTNCEVFLRGLYVDPKQKINPGQRKLYLHFVGDTRYDVSSAYREVKRVVEELSMTGGNFL